MNNLTGPNFDNSFARLADRFFVKQLPVPVKSPELIRLNGPLAEKLGLNLDWLQSEQGVQVLAGNKIADGSQPIATAYAGHQFGNWVPQLGDGRAILLGEVIDSEGCRFDIQLNGAGATPYSRGGDGRAPLGPVLREYIVSEAMAVLGVPTTRSLAAVASGENLYRDEVLPAAILTRVASSHIRIGTFQYFAAQGDVDAVRILADHVIERHFVDVKQAQRPYLALLERVIEKQASLIARWQQIGFIHGVMNTDNMLLSGETIDYGPCAFMDNYHPNTVYSSIDQRGRYAYVNQPVIANWNLGWLAGCLLPLIDENKDRAVEMAETALRSFNKIYESAYHQAMHKKLGLVDIDEHSQTMVSELLDLMSENATDYTLCFRYLTEQLDSGATENSVAAFFQLESAFDSWQNRWKACLSARKIDFQKAHAMMIRANPVFIPRNHLIEEVIASAQIKSDYEPFHQLVERLASPYVYDPSAEQYARPPRPEQVVTRTFCGT